MNVIKGFCQKYIAPISLSISCLFSPIVAHGEQGVFEDRILFGQSAALKGPAAALGHGMRQGLLAAFTEANENGGIAGRKLQLVTYNDGYEPEQAIVNTTRLIEQDDVFALVGEVGTPTSKAVQPITTELGIPFIGPFTGAAFLRDAALDNVINVRASYDQETESWIKHLTEDLGITRIAILYQDDSFGRAGLSGVLKAMEKRNMTLVAEGTYKRNTVAVKRAVLAIRKGKPEAVVMVGAYRPCAEFIRVARSIDMNPVFVNISFVGSKALAEELGQDGAGVVVTQVVPFPEQDDIPLVARYQQAMRSIDASPEFGFVSLEGYMVGRLLLAALEKMGSNLSRDRLVPTIREMGTIDLDGMLLTYGPNDNQGSDMVFLTEIQPDGRFKAIDSLAN